jgi:hypothetical protein
MKRLLRLAFHAATAVSAVLWELTIFMAIAGRCTAPRVTLATNRRIGSVITLHREYEWAAGRGMALVVLEAKHDPSFPDQLRWLESVPTFQVVLSPGNGDGSRYELYRAAARDEFGLVITPVQASYDDGMDMSGVLFPSIVRVILFSLLPGLAFPRPSAETASPTTGSLPLLWI